MTTGHSIGSDNSFLLLRVECYSGYRGEETPRRFFMGPRRVEVRKIIDRWFGPDHRYFKVEGEDGCIYLLRHSDRSGTWSLEVFQSSGENNGGPPLN